MAAALLRLRRGLRAAALLGRAPRRAAAAQAGDPEQPDTALQEAEESARRRRRAARLQRLRRELGPERGAAERSLSREAMEQMRFLRRELPEEWPLERLARSFGVSAETARRVLRSRWSPEPGRARRQDARAAGTGTGTETGTGAGAGTGAAGAGARAGREVRGPDGRVLFRLPP